MPTTKKKNKENADPIVDFKDTAIAFSDKTDEELKNAAFLFKMMNKQWLVNAGSYFGLWGVQFSFPGFEKLVKNTIFKQFVGGTTLLESQDTIHRLYKHKVLSILDYGAEAKTSEKDFNFTMNENIRAIDFAATNASVPVVSTKITGLARFGLLQKIQDAIPLSMEERREYRNILKRIDSICHHAQKKKVSVFFDAEESWIQDTIDHLVNMMMARYNKQKAVVYNTFQLYRHDRLQYLISSFNIAVSKGYILGAKLVRGAYMEKERERALKMNYPSPIHPNKEACDDAYNTAIRFCVDNYTQIASCNATHNEKSCLLQASLIKKKNIQRDHAHLNFCQLYGMSDNITFNLTNAGYNVAKYLPYGSVKDVLPYLIRRARENTAVVGEASREYGLILKEIKRRKLNV